MLSKYRVPTMQNRLGNLIRPPSKKSCYHQGFFAEGERFLSFWRCHRPRKRAALVVWLISSRGLNQPHHITNSRCEALASLKGCFFYVFVSVPQYFSAEPKIRLPTNFPQCHFTGGGWCFVAENKKRESN